MRRLVRSAVLLACAACLVTARAQAQDRPAPTVEKPVVLLGFDGLSADRVERLMAENKLPHLAALAARGGYTRLATSNPAQSPTAWASIITGRNPGGTGIYDFLRRIDRDPTRVDFSHASKDEDARVLVGPTLRVALLGGAALAGALLGLGAAFLVAAVARNPEWRKKKKLAGFLAGGAAVAVLAAFAVLRWLPEKGPKGTQLRSGEALWKTFDNAGVRAVALEAPLCFPPDAMDHGCCSAGLGVPDMAGGWGSFALWTDDPDVDAATDMMGSGMYVLPEEDGTFELVIPGADHPLRTKAQKVQAAADAATEREVRTISLDWSRTRSRLSQTREALLSYGAKLTAKFPVVLRRGRDATVTLQDGSAVVLQPGVWSELLPVEFVVSPVLSMHGRVRLLLEAPGSVEPPRPFRLFVGQVQWDYAKVPPIVDLTSPRSFAPELAAAAGPTETIGWPEMTNPLKNDMLDDRSFVRHTYLVMKGREAKLHDRLRRRDFQFLFALFAEPDRVQHALYRHVDEKCPTHDPKAAAEFAGEIDKIYVEADRIVGDTVKAAGDGATVMVVSDHGFAPFRRGVNLNMLLQSKGWQVKTGEGSQLGVINVGKGGFFGDLDWSQTRAYATGLGTLYLNLAGREPTGIVPPAKADAVMAGIMKDLMDLRDEDGAKVVRAVYRGKDIYKGERLIDAPDLIVGFEWGYRVSWQGTLGGRDSAVITPNLFRWSGDHCSVDPSLVPGVMFSSLPIAKDAKPTVEDVTPTVLSLFGLKSPGANGRNVLNR